MNFKNKLSVIILGAAIISGYYGIHKYILSPDNLSVNPSPPQTQIQTINKCNSDLWQHIYKGRFNSAQNRLTIIESCKSVIGIIKSAIKEKDGDWHIRLDVENKNLLNDKNITGQNGYLVLEPICSNPISQKDVLEEKVCQGFNQNIFDKSMVEKRVEVIGAYVKDEEHGWLEIHPITSLKVVI